MELFYENVKYQFPKCRNLALYICVFI